jgi:uncharacterized glyoxalase superfamily protein PhnB
MGGFEFPAVVPYLFYRDATEALDFLQRAFGFREHSVSRGPDGAVWNAQLWAGSGLVMIGPGAEEFGTRPVTDREWASCRIHVLVDDLEVHHRRAVDGGAVMRSEVGLRFGDVRIYVAGDCGGHQWIFAQPVTDDR